MICEDSEALQTSGRDTTSGHVGVGVAGVKLMDQSAPFIHFSTT